MEDELKDDANISKEQEEADLDTADGENNESASDLEQRLAKAEELANNYKIRAEKAEKLVKSVKTNEPQKQSQTGELAQKDVIYLAKADIHDEDIDEVLQHASKTGLSVKEAHEYLKPILAVRTEQRNVANASNTGSSKRSSGKVADDVLLAKASKGELPADDADLERLIRLRKGYKN